MLPHRGSAFGSWGATAGSAAEATLWLVGSGMARLPRLPFGRPFWATLHRALILCPKQSTQLFGMELGSWDAICCKDEASRGLLSSPGQGQGWEVAEGWCRLGASMLDRSFFFFQVTEKRGKESKSAFGGPVVSSLYQEETIRWLSVLDLVKNSIFLMSFCSAFFNTSQVWWQLQQDNKWQERTFQVHNHLNQ